MKNLLFLFAMFAVHASAGIEPVDMVSTPEPGTMILLGAGLVGFGFLSLRRNKRGN